MGPPPGPRFSRGPMPPLDGACVLCRPGSAAARARHPLLRGRFAPASTGSRGEIRDRQSGSSSMPANSSTAGFAAGPMSARIMTARCRRCDRPSGRNQAGDGIGTDPSQRHRRLHRDRAVDVVHGRGSAGMPNFAAGPMFPSALAASRRTPGSRSLRALTRSVMAALAAGPRFPSAWAACARTGTGVTRAVFATRGLPARPRSRWLPAHRRRARRPFQVSRFERLAKSGDRRLRWRSDQLEGRGRLPGRIGVGRMGAAPLPPARGPPRHRPFPERRLPCCGRAIVCP